MQGQPKINYTTTHTGYYDRNIVQENMMLQHSRELTMLLIAKIMQQKQKLKQQQNMHTPIYLLEYAGHRCSIYSYLSQYTNFWFCCNDLS